MLRTSQGLHRVLGALGLGPVQVLLPSLYWNWAGHVLLQKVFPHVKDVEVVTPMSAIIEGQLSIEFSTNPTRRKSSMNAEVIHLVPRSATVSVPDSECFLPYGFCCNYSLYPCGPQAAINNR